MQFSYKENYQKLIHVVGKNVEKNKQRRQIFGKYLLSLFGFFQ